MQGLQPGPGNVGVNLGGRQVRMPQQHLHTAQVSTMVQQMGGKCVPQ